mgnify:CR=1 FL=1|jgi:hypothetical protein
MIYLYVKTHNETNLKYFGKTIRDDYEKYSGSGKHWKSHLKKHGNNIKTVLVFASDDINEIESVALRFSEENNIVESKGWANLIPENGRDGGSLSEHHTEGSRKKMSDNRRGKVGIPAGWKHDDDTKERMSKKAKERCDRMGAPKGAFKIGNVPHNKGTNMTEEQKALLSDRCKKQKKHTCEHCDREFAGGNFTLWHGDNCKEKKNG